MVIHQGDIVKLNFNPTKGHEQKGFRPAVVISNDIYNKHTNLLLVVPITNSNNTFPMHIPLDKRTKTTGYVQCEHVRSVDRSAREVSYVESLPSDIREYILKMVTSAIE